MKKKITPLLLLVYTFGFLICKGQNLQQQKLAADNLWDMYHITRNEATKITPAEIRTNRAIRRVNEINLTSFNQNALQNAVTKLLDAKDLGTGGIIRFPSNSNTISLRAPILFERQTPMRNGQFQQRTLLIDGNGLSLNGRNRETIFIIENNIRVIVQNVTFKNANFSKNLVSDEEFQKREGRGGGAILVDAHASFRAFNCGFINNRVTYSNGMDTRQGGGENYNGGAIRLNNFSTGEINACIFMNNRGFTGGAIGGTSIEKIIVRNSFFENNISTGFKDTRRFGVRIMNSVEGAGAIRIDRSIEPVEFYGSSFTKNKANVKVSTIEVFARPVNEGQPNESPIARPYALIIDDCIFEDNEYFNNYRIPEINLNNNNNVPKEGILTALLFHSGSLAAKMSMANSVFQNNQVGQANVRISNSFDFKNISFMDTNYITTSPVDQTKAGLFLQEVKGQSTIENCIFYNNRTTLNRNSRTGTEIMSFDRSASNKVNVSGSIFYGTRGSAPIVGTGNSNRGFSSFNRGRNNFYYIRNWEGNGVLPQINRIRDASRNINPQLTVLNTPKRYRANSIRKTIEIPSFCFSNNSINGSTLAGGQIEKCNPSSKNSNANNLTLKNDIKVFPVPTEKNIFIKGIQANDFIEIFNLKGNLIKSFNTTSNSKLQIDVSLYNSGIYLIKINHKFTSRFIKL